MRKFTIIFVAAFALALTSSAANQSQQTRTSQSSQTQKAQPAQQRSQAGASASASAASSTSANANAGPASASAGNGTAVNADLLTTIDARKVHPGQRVEAKTTKDVKEGKRVVMRRGTKLVGHVTEAQAHTKDHAESAVGIVFDQAIVGKGETVPFHASIQALAVAQSVSEARMGDDDMMPSPPMGGGAVRGGGGLVGGAAGGATGAVGSTAGMAGGVARTAGGTLRSTSSVAGSAAGSVAGSAQGATRGLDAEGNLTSTCSGVFGLNGLNLASSASSATEGSVITSANRNVHLASGTQMLLRSDSQLGHDADEQSHGANKHPDSGRTPNRGEKQ